MTRTLTESTEFKVLTFLHARYVKFLNEESSYTAQSQCHKLLKAFSKELKVAKVGNKAGIVVQHASLSRESTVCQENFNVPSIKETAAYL